MGLATAYSICRTGDSKILLLDRYGIGNEYCSSNDVNRVFRYSYGNDEHYTRMAVESLKLWKNLEGESGQRLLLPTGLFMLEGEELEKRFPQFRAEKGFLDPHGGVLLASKALYDLSSLIQKQGVTVRKGQAVKLVLGA